MTNLVPLCWVLLAQPAGIPVADPVDADVAVAPLKVAGTVPPRALTELQFHLDAGLDRIDASFAALDVDAQCDNAGCLSDAARHLNAQYVLWPKVAVAERDYTITLELLDASDGTLLASAAQQCEVCGVQEAAETLGRITATILSKIEALQLGPAVLEITSTPVGAVVEVDGEPAGQTPVERELEEGDHWVSARLAGYVTQRHQVRAVSGVREGLELTLVRLPREISKGPGKLEIAGWSLLGVGAASLATGVVLIVLEERPNRLNCDGENVDPVGKCKFRYATLEPGIGVLAAGGALAVAGLTMALIGRKRTRKMNASAVITPQGFGVGAIGRF